MSKKQFEQCTLEEATHVEVNGKVHKFGHHEGNQVHRYSINNIEIRKETGGWQLIHSDAFSVLGIKPLKEIKREPREFVHIFRKGSSMSYPSWAENGMFRCVEIVEEEK